jgi:4-amino-4-deoxy-L-arabinose transferase-like glycosyltransferase
MRKAATAAFFFFAPMLPRIKLPPVPALLAVIALAYVLPGLASHAPWKSFDAITIEVIHGMSVSGDWVVPRVAGRPWLADPPLYYWIGLAFAKLFGTLLRFHDAARLASGALVLVAMGFLALAARELAAPEERRAMGATAPLVLIGSIGLLVHAHEAITDLSSLAAAAAALAFLARATRRPLGSGIGFGAALGAAFLGTGPAVPAAFAAAALLAHLVCDAWRNRRGLIFLAAAVLVFTLVAASWPLALEQRSPRLLAAWWSGEVAPEGSFLGNLEYFLGIAGWFAWPGWLLGLWGLWARRWRWREPQVFAPLAAFVFLFGAIAYAGPPQDVNGIVWLPPLALLSALGITTLRRGAANALDWFGVMTFSFFTGLVWLSYVAMMLGVPPRIAQDFARMAPGFDPRFAALPFAVALALTLGWAYLVFFTAREPTRSVTRWAAGIVLLWGSFAMLLLPWADYQKSYRGVVLELEASLRGHAGCIEEISVGAPQRALLNYYAGVRTQPYRAAHPNACRLLLVAGPPEREEHAPGAGWAKIADVGRPGDRHERLRLYWRRH